jgi:methylmalonyl-CoA mutase cobalamin-binding domain/chain
MSLACLCFRRAHGINPARDGVAAFQRAVACKAIPRGIIPDEDLHRLKEMGVTGVFGPGANTEDIIRDIKQAVAV